jgi:flagellin-like hook-associated protein FlgL
VSSGITISSNLASLNAQRRFSDNLKALESAYTRLSSGLRINRASDDAAGLAIAEALNTDARVYSQGVKNVNDAISLQQIEESALLELSNITIRQRELTEQVANGVYSTKQRQAMNQEAQALTNEYNRIIQSTQFNGIPIFTKPGAEFRTCFGAGLANSLGVKFAADFASKLEPGTYFMIGAPEGDSYVWFTIDGQGTDPLIAGAAGIRVDLFTNEGSAEATELGFQPGNAIPNNSYFKIYSPTNEYTVWFSANGGGTDPRAGGSSTEVVIGTDLQEKTDLTFTDGQSLLSRINAQGDAYFTINSPQTGYYVWFNVNDDLGDAQWHGSDPGLDPANHPELAVLTGIEVQTYASYAADTLVWDVASVLDAGTSHELSCGIDGSILQALASDSGAVADAHDINSGAAIFVVEQGGTETNAEEIKQRVAAALQGTGEFRVASSTMPLKPRGLLSLMVQQLHVSWRILTSALNKARWRPWTLLMPALKRSMLNLGHQEPFNRGCRSS